MKKEQSNEDNNNAKKDKPQYFKGSSTPISINLSLLTNKSSITNLIAKAKEIQISNSIRQQKIKTDGAEEKSDQQRPLPKQLAQSTPTPNFIRSNRRGINNTTQEKGKLNILMQLNHQNNLLQYNNKTSNFLETPEQIINFNNSPRSPVSKSPNKNIENVKIGTFYTCKTSQTVCGFSYREDQNRQYKDSMEDKGISIDNFNSKQNQTLFCLFDGHGGDLVSRYLQKNFATTYKKNLESLNDNIENTLKITFRDIDHQIQKCDYITMGSTGCIVHIIKENSYSLKIYCANVGDTRCSLISRVAIKRLSYDHKGSDPIEKDRIIKSGGSIINDRVMGQLMLTRAFGDFEFKTFGVRVEPHIQSITIDPEEKSQFLIIGCDGIWDVLSEEDVQHIIMFGSNDPEELCKSIMKNALLKGAWDNLSLFVIRLS